MNSWACRLNMLIFWDHLGLLSKGSVPCCDSVDICSLPTVKRQTFLFVGPDQLRENYRTDSDIWGPAIHQVKGTCIAPISGHSGPSE